MKELNLYNFPNLDFLLDIETVTYMGFPMPDVEGYDDLGVYGSIFDVSVDDFLENIDQFNLDRVSTPNLNGVVVAFGN
jgi:hypothetical protein